jgi:hypothetical protein
MLVYNKAINLDFRIKITMNLVMKTQLLEDLYFQIQVPHEFSASQLLLMGLAQ